MDGLNFVLVIFYLPVPFIYNVVDIIVLSACGCFSWPTTLTLRTILILADFSWAIVYAVNVDEWYPWAGPGLTGTTRKTSDCFVQARLLLKVKVNEHESPSASHDGSSEISREQ